MEWMVQLADGTAYGPLNIFAIRQLLADGVVAPDGILTNKITGQTGKASALLSPEAMAMIEVNMRLARELRERESLLLRAHQRIGSLEYEIYRMRNQPGQTPPAAPPRAIDRQIRRQATGQK